MRIINGTYGLSRPLGPAHLRARVAGRRADGRLALPSPHDASTTEDPLLSHPGTCYVEQSTAILFVVMGGLASDDRAIIALREPVPC